MTAKRLAARASIAAKFARRPEWVRRARNRAALRRFRARQKAVARFAIRGVLLDNLSRSHRCARSLRDLHALALDDFGQVHERTVRRHLYALRELGFIAKVKEGWVKE